jgi:hypothetical protein
VGSRIVEQVDDPVVRQVVGSTVRDTWELATPQNSNHQGHWDQTKGTARSETPKGSNPENMTGTGALEVSCREMCPVGVPVRTPKICTADQGLEKLDRKSLQNQTKGVELGGLGG